MDAMGWGTLFAVLALAALLALVALGFWWWSQRTAARPSGRRRISSLLDDDDDADEAGPEDPEAAGLIEVIAPDRRGLLHQLYALAFEEAGADPRPLPAEVEHHEAIAAAIANLLSRAEFSARHLPRRPQLLPKLMQALNNPNASLDQVARVIGEDPALSANLLRIANSPFYRVRKKPVEGLLRAATLLGLDGLRPVVSAALVQPVLPGGKTVFGRLPVLLWEHAQQAAAIASELVREQGNQDDASAAQMLGLLHGLGAIAVVQVLRDQYALHAHLRPWPQVLALTLDAQTVPMAQRIAASWEQSERIDTALAALQRDSLPADVLGRALGIGQMVSMLVMLQQHGKFDRATGLAILQAWGKLQGVTVDLERLWTRAQP